MATYSRMVTKTSYYTQTQLERLAALVKIDGIALMTIDGIDRIDPLALGEWTRLMGLSCWE